MGISKYLSIKIRIFSEERNSTYNRLIFRNLNQQVAIGIKNF